MSRPHVGLCSWDEKVVSSAGWLLVEERFADPNIPTNILQFCSHDHLRKWAEQVIADSNDVAPRRG